MIYLIVGGSCAGKTSITLNTFVKDKIIVYKDLVTLTASGNAIILGDYSRTDRRKGTDTIPRQYLSKMALQIDKLLKEYPDRDIVLEGVRIVSRNLFNHIRDLNVPTKLILVRCDTEKSIERYKKNNPLGKEKVLRADITKAENIYKEYANVFDGEIIDTNNVTDFTTIKIK